MSHTRRDFIRFVVAGSIASGCPVDQALLAEPPGGASGSTAPGPIAEGEHFAICHQLRDGHSFPKPDATKKTEVVIVGCCLKKRITSEGTRTRKPTKARSSAPVRPTAIAATTVTC